MVIICVKTFGWIKVSWDEGPRDELVPKKFFQWDNLAEGRD